MRPELTARGTTLAGLFACGLWLSGCLRRRMRLAIDPSADPPRTYGGGWAVQEFQALGERRGSRPPWPRRWMT